MKTTQIEVVMFHKLKHADLMEDGFNRVSYGDAEFTLVKAADLIRELKDDMDDSLDPLIDELSKVPKGVLVALTG